MSILNTTREEFESLVENFGILPFQSMTVVVLEADGSLSVYDKKE